MATNSVEPPEYDSYDRYKRVETSEEVTKARSSVEEPRIETPDSGPRRSRSVVFKRWWLEILSTLVSIGVLIAIYTLLKQYDGRQTSDWTMSINLTTLVAILSTFGRMSLVTIVSSVIAQAKWSKFWLREEGGEKREQNIRGQPLKDMDVYDSASRGTIWDLMQLFVKGVRSPSVIFSVLVMLLSIAMASFAQQAVRTVNCEYADNVGGNVGIPTIQTLGNLGSSGDGGSTRIWDKSRRHRLSYTTKARLISAIANPAGVDSHIRATCSTGNCTFPLLQDDQGRHFTHRAMGFCSKCVDTTLQTNYSAWPGTTGGSSFTGVLSKSVYGWSLPTGQNVTYSRTLSRGAGGTGGTQGFQTTWNTAILNVKANGLNLDWISRRHQDEVRKFIKTSTHGYANISFLSLQDLTLDDSPWDWNTENTEGPRALATACTVYPCLKSYLASMIDNKFEETLVSAEDLPLYGDLMLIVENGSNPGGFHQIVFPSDAIRVVSPCLVDGQVYTESNMSSAPGVMTLTRLKFDEMRAAFDTDVPLAPGATINDNPNATKITAPAQCVFGVDHWDWYASMRGFFAEAFTGTCGIWQYNGFGTSGAPACLGHYDAAAGVQPDQNPSPWWLEQLTRTRNRTTAAIDEWMDSLTESMTRRFRLSDELYGKQSWNDDFRSINGTVMHTTTCFAIEWQWLTFPLVLTVIVTVVLLWTLIKGLFGFGTAHGREMIWKSSILPLIYHQERFMPIDDYDRATEYHKRKDEGWIPLMDLGQMNKDAKEYKVAFDG